MTRRRLSYVFVYLCLILCAPLAAQAPSGLRTPTGLQPAPPAGAPAERLGPSLYRLGRIRVDTAKREIAIPGTINDATILEFVANTVGGFKAYESALTLETNAVMFNTALVLIGLDKANARLPERHFDPIPPAGDPVDIFVEWRQGSTDRRVRVEQLLFDKQTGKTLEGGAWVYTGSAFAPNGGPFLAENDGVLIGFAHSPAPVIENSGPGTVGRYGSVVLNTQIGVRPGMAVTVTVRALPRTPALPR